MYNSRQKSFDTTGKTGEFALKRCRTPLVTLRGSEVGLHQDLLNHMGVKNYTELNNKWEKAKNKGAFIDKLRDGYSNYFFNSPDYGKIMEIIDKSLDNIL